jgi:hypothetical protein
METNKPYSKASKTPLQQVAKVDGVQARLQQRYFPEWPQLSDHIVPGVVKHFTVKAVDSLQQDPVPAFCAGDEPGAAPHPFGLFHFIQGSQRTQGHDPQLR